MTLYDNQYGGIYGFFQGPIVISILHELSRLKPLPGEDLVPDSIIIINSIVDYDGKKTNKIRLKDIRHLTLNSHEIHSITNNIELLYNLQYLDLSNNAIYMLPHSIVNLCNLKYLFLHDTKIKDLPLNIGNLKNLQYLDLHSSRINNIPQSIGELSNLKSLDLSNTNINKLPDSIDNLYNLNHLDLHDTKIEELPQKIENLCNLNHLDLHGTKIKEIPKGLKGLNNLHQLNLHSTPIINLPDSIGSLYNLKILTLHNTQIKALPNSIGNLSKLRHLEVYNTQISELPQSICNLSNLEYFDLNDTQISFLPESIEKLSKLQSLSLGHTIIQKLPKSIGNLKNLQSLDLKYTGVCELPENIGELRKLQHLDLEGAPIREVPESVWSLNSLQSLALGKTQIQKLPESIGNLKNLCQLDLRELHLIKIEKSLIDLNLRFYENERFLSSEVGINVYGLSLDTQPASLFLQPRPLIEEYFASEMVAVNTTKCIILGYGNVGKTHTLLRILNDGEEGNYITKETPGVEIHPYRVKQDSGSFTINFWDFGGQEIMYSMHRCFLTERSCYLIVVDNRRSDIDMMAQARYWLKNIANFTSGAPVIIMANMWEKDEYRDDLEIKRLREEFGNSVDLKCVIPISAKTSSKQQFKHEFMDRLIGLSSDMVSRDMELPIKWNQIRLELHEMGNEHGKYYISQQDYYTICQKCGVENRGIQNWLLDWFNDLGDCFSYYKPDAKASSSILEEYKILDPRWITNAIYILISRGYGFVDHQRSPGILTKTTIEKILEKAEGGVIEYITEYKDFECTYIMRVMEKFELAYDVSRDGSKYFIPALLTKKEPERKRPEKYNQLVKYVLKYNFLPSNTLQKLMVRYYDELELSRCWDKGMVLRNAAIDQWVLLDMGGGDDKLNIEVYSCGQDPACKMLNLVLYRLQKVNESLSLKPIHYIITPDEYEEEIEVEHLLELKNGPRKSSYYQGRKTDYFIDELLGNMFGPVAGYVKEISAKEPIWESKIPPIDTLYEGLRKFVEDKDVSIIITRGMSKDIEKLTDLLYENLPVLTEAIKEIAKSDVKLAEDLRDINVQMTISRGKNEEALQAKQSLIQKLSTSADLVTIGQGLLTAANALSNPILTDTILRLLQ